MKQVKNIIITIIRINFLIDCKLRKQSFNVDNQCLDTLGHLLDGSVGVHPCHNAGGNQVDQVAEPRGCI